jgi:beta-1,3-galactosyltransferase 1
VIFLLGSVLDPMLQYQIEEENKKFKDIVQGQFIDSYRNLTNKGVSLLRTLTDYIGFLSSSSACCFFVSYINKK